MMLTCAKFLRPPDLAQFFSSQTMLSEIVYDQHRIKYLDPHFSALPDPLHFMLIPPTISSMPRKLFPCMRAQVDEELLFPDHKLNAA
jgi:hypothetical protein